MIHKTTQLTFHTCKEGTEDVEHNKKGNCILVTVEIKLTINTFNIWCLRDWSNNLTEPKRLEN